MQRRNYTFLITILLFQSLLGQIKIHKYLSAQDGLANNNVHRIMCDSQGYMWFGTFNGVSRWDGKNFKNITKSNGLISSPVIDFIESDDGTMYFSNYTKGIISYKNGELDTIDTEDGLAGNMVIRMRKYNGHPIFFSEKAQLYRNDSLININYYFPKITTRASDFLEDETGIYGASRDASILAGLYVKDKYVDSLFTKKDGLISNQVDLIEKDHSGDIIIATSKGPNKYSKGKIYTLKYKGKDLIGVTNDVHVGLDGTNYYGGDYGVAIEKNGTVELLTTENGLLENQVTAIGEDKNGTMYFGHENSGISIYNPERFTNYISHSNPTDFIANAIIQTKSNNILLGTQNGVSIIEQETISSTDKNILNSIKNEFILSMKKSNNGNIIFGTKKGFGIYDNGKLSKYNFDRISFYQDINSIEISPDEDILLAERRLGLLIFTPNNQSKRNFINYFITNPSNPVQNLFPNQKYISNIDEIKTEILKDGKLTYVTYKNGLLSNRILDMKITSDSSLIIGFHGRGANIYKNGVFTSLTSEQGLTDQIVNSVFEHSDGSYWFGTSSGGICIYKNNRIIDTLNINDGLSSNDIRGIVEIDNKIYASTSNGLNVILKYADEYFVRQINESDGLLSNVCNLNSILVDKNKNIWIGTNKGVTKYNPQMDKVISTPPKIIISGLQLFNEDYPFDEFKNNPELNYDQNYLKFIFTAVNLSAPDNVLFKFKLSGIDKDWVSSTTNNAQYTSLDDGEYTFEVKARNEWGYWSEPTSLSFVINPAWWETWWFYTLAFIAIGSLIAFIASYRYRNLLEVEKIRTKISADLHDSIGSGLSEITILSEILHSQPNAKQEDLQSGLKNISVTARSLVGNMSDIVWLVNPSKDSLKDLLLRLQDSYQEVFAQANISFKINGIENLEQIQLPLTYRQHLFLLFKEAINNSLKYSECTKIDLDINVKGKFLNILYQENGKGFDKNAIKDSGNGLKNMKNRAENIGGICEITSELNKGTQISFSGKIEK
ncbi:MAG: hypothetical protein H6610_07260 [Ignavibacteriales bacterium]|nr:hypothetical protein [Ignavibacteriales bacterium]